MKWFTSRNMLPANLVRGAVIALAAVAFGQSVALGMNVNYPAGSLLDGTIQQEVNTKTAEDGQRFTVMTSSGSLIIGHLSQVARAAVGRKAHVTLNVDAIRFTDGTSRTLHATVVGVATQKQTNYLQAAGTIVGAMIVGNVLGKAIGTNAGGLVGVAGGTLLAANTSQNIIIPQGAAIRVKLTEPLTSRQQAR